MDTEFQIKSALETIRSNEDLIPLANANQRRSLRAQNRKLREKIRGLRDALSESYDPEFAECRDMGHSWVKSYRQINNGTVERALMCSRCEAERHEAFSQDGFLLMRKYKHPNGYLLDGDVASVVRHSRAFWRAFDFDDLEADEATDA